VLLNEDGEFVKGSETKSLVNELQVECEKSTSILPTASLLSKSDSITHFTAQEVAAMLREKLVTASGDLVVAKSRVRELEMDLLEDKMSLKRSAETLLASSSFSFVLPPFFKAFWRHYFFRGFVCSIRILCYELRSCADAGLSIQVSKCLRWLLS